MQGKVSPEQDAPIVYVGVDVCKDWLDVYLHPLGRALRVANSREGIKRLKRELTDHSVKRIVMEATAKYHRQAHRSLSAAGFAVAVVNPLRSRLFAEAAGVLAKTDRVDARILAVLGESLAPDAKAPIAQAIEELQELFSARTAAMAELTALINRLGASTVRFLRTELTRRIKATQAHIDRLDDKLRDQISIDLALARRYAILTSIPGVGPVAAMGLLLGLAELGSCSAKAASHLAGLAPFADDSGERAGARHIRGGRAHVRIAIYMAAVAAARCNPDLAAFYKRLREHGKKPKVAITAVMRKLVVLANTLLKEDRYWQRAAP
jgi:transposase